MDAVELLMMLGEDEFGLLELPVKAAPVTADDRVVAAFEEITDFVRRTGRPPAANPTDIGEWKLAKRLQALAEDDDKRAMLEPNDELGLLVAPEPPASIEEAIDDDPFGLLSGGEDLFELRHVPANQRAVTPAAEKARRGPCEDFEEFAPLFKAVHADLRSGDRKLRPFQSPKYIQRGYFFVVGGVLAYVADESERHNDSGGRANARLRVIYENGTESPILLQSFATALYKVNGKRVSESDEMTADRMGLSPATPMASVYVLRSLSQDPQLAEFPALHKIGSTSSTAVERTGRAQAETTFLGAPVEIVEEYRVPRGVEKKVEHLLHRLFAPARIDAWFERNGKTVAEANEWFAVPFSLIDEAVGLIENEAIVNYEYDAETQSLRLR